jgi:hypothetical protein
VEEEIVERSGTMIRGRGGGNDIIERSGTRMGRCGEGKEVVERSGVGPLSQRNGREAI